MADDDSNKEKNEARQKPDTGQANPFGMPDLNQLFSQMRMPGIDFEQLMQEGRKNIEAVQAANQAVTEGWQALAQKQMEIFQQTMQSWSEGISEATSGSSTENLEKRSEAARQGFDQALANMRSLAEIASDSQAKALDIMRTRFEENIQNMRNPGSNNDD